MASNFTRPTLSELIARAWTDIQGAVSGLAEWLRRSVEYGFARAVAGMAHGLHGHASWIVDQAFVQFAEEAALLRRGDERGVPRNAAAKATGPITLTGAGGNISADTLFTRLADGWTYKATAAHVGLTPPTNITIEAADGWEGVEGNLAAGQTLSFVSSVSGFESAVTVASGGLVGGADVEDLEDYRERLHDNLRTPVMGGAPGDHRRWALEVSGVTRAWEYKGIDGVGNPALGRVAIAFVCDDATPTIVPDAPKREEVRAHVQSKSNAQVVVVELFESALNYTASVVPNTATVRAAVEAEVADMISREAEPGLTIRLSNIDEAISFADGETSHELTSPVADVTVAFDRIAVPGTATFVDP